MEAKVQASLILGGCLGNHDLGSLEIMGIKGEGTLEQAVVCIALENSIIYAFYFIF